MIFKVWNGGLDSGLSCKLNPNDEFLKQGTIEYTSTEFISVSWEANNSCIMLQNNTKITVEIE